MTRRSIGELARAAGVHVETVRYYERRGLLPEPPRTPSGYRVYDDDALRRLQLVARAKDLGFTLTEIRELVGSTPTAAADVLCAARAKLADVEHRLDDLGAQRDRLRALVQTCETGDDDGCTTLAIGMRTTKG